RVVRRVRQSNCHARSDQRVNRLSVFDHVNRAAGRVDELCVPIDAQYVKYRGHEILRANGLRFGHVSLGGRLAYDLPGLEPATGEGQRRERGPVIAAGVAIDLGSAAELAGD